MAQQGETADRGARLREALVALVPAINASVVRLRQRWRASRAFLARARDLLLAWRQTSAEQRYLASLSDHDLKDLGLSREDFARDSTHFFWRR